MTGTVLLEHKIVGNGAPLVLLHGLFGSKENLGMLARPLAEQFQVISVDLRNHGRSFHAPTMNYPVMAADVCRLLDHLQISQASVLGHSMGGKVAMQMALSHPARIIKLVVADIAPAAYAQHHQDILQGLQLIDSTELQSRQQADEILKPFEPDLATRQFLLTNLYRDAEKKLGLRLNIEAITRHQQDICDAVSGPPFKGPTLFIRGGNSDYIQDIHLPVIKALFPHFQLETVPNAGHMLHAEQPQEFLARVVKFLVTE